MEETMKEIDESPALDREAVRSTWDTIVIGAGPAGALAARELAPDGLSRTSVRDLPEFAPSIASNSRVGIGAVITGEFEVCPIGQITMVLSRAGYVGISRVREHQFNVAAAVDRKALLRSTPAKIVA